jgi:hypothetical protein
MTASTTTLRLAMWHAWRAPGRAPPPLGGGFGTPNQSPDPLVRRAGRDHRFPVSACSLWREREFQLLEGGDTGDLPSHEKKLRVLNPTPGFPHGGTPVSTQCPSPPRGRCQEIRGREAAQTGPSGTCRSVAESRIRDWLIGVPSSPAMSSMYGGIQIRQEQGKPRKDARRGRCHPLE